MDDTELPTSISTIENSNSILVYPNPTGNLLIVDFQKEHKGIVEFNFIDINGKIIKSFQLDASSKNEFYINDLPNGIYFLEMKNQSFRAVQKVVKF